METVLRTRLYKLQVLAERGESGEREAATKKIELLCRKHNISATELEDDEVEIHWFRYPSKGYQYKLLHQCIYKTIGAETKYRIYQRGKTWEVGIKCTKAQAVEIELDFAFYSVNLIEEQARHYSAFLSMNSIYPLDAPKGAGKDYNEEDIHLMKGIRPRTRLAQIEGTKQ